MLTDSGVTYKLQVTKHEHPSCVLVEVLKACVVEVVSECVLVKAFVVAEPCVVGEPPVVKLSVPVESSVVV